MARRSVPNQRQSLDPLFYIPEGMEDDWNYPENYGIDDEDTELDIEDDVSDEDDGPETPDILGVVSQTVRRAADGSFVIDVIIDVEDIPGITKYDIRVTKTT